jgi:hypothetical protein
MGQFSGAMLLPDITIEFQDTPNPNALKCILPRPVPGRGGPGLRSYSTPAEAATDPLASALLALPGFANVLIHETWVTVGRVPGADWRTVKAGLRKVLGEAL